MNFSIKNYKEHANLNWIANRANRVQKVEIWTLSNLNAMQCGFCNTLVFGILNCLEFDRGFQGLNFPVQIHSARSYWR